MKNAKRILLFALALVALTLVMSLSIFAEEATEPVECEVHTYDWKIGGCPTCGTVAVPDEVGGKVSTNLGYSVFFASSWSEINANVSASSTYKVIKLTADTTVPSGNNYAKVQNANIYIDLGGHSITSSVGLAPLYLYAADALVNGKIIHNYGRQALYVCNVNLIENIDIVVGATYANNTTGIYLANKSEYAAGFEGSTGSYIGAMKNVTIDSKRDANGNYIDGNTGLFNHGIEFSSANSVIGNLENVKIYSRGQALTLMAKQIGTMTNCVFDGTNIGLNIGNLQCNINLVNCVVSSETLAVRIAGASSNELSFNFDENTAISSNGSVYYIPDNIKGYAGFESLTTAVALVNGVLYGTLEDAMAAVLASTEEVTTFTLIGDLTLDAPIVINKVVEFSFGGGTFKIPTTGDKTFTEMTAPGYTVTALNGAFVVVEGGALTITGDGTLVGNENAIVANGGNVVVEAGTYVGYNPVAFVDTNACVANNDGTYTIADHKYDDGVMNDKVTYKVDGDCEVCGFVRGSYAVNYVYYATLEEAIAAATESGYQIVLATNIVLENDTTWDLTGYTFNFNGRTVTGNLSIIGGTFTTDVTTYLADGYCCKKVNNVGYVVSVHNCVAGAPAADGSVTYTCAGCDETYVINNGAVNGEYYLGTDKVVFNNGVLSAMGGEFSYTYNVTSGMIDTTNAGIYFQVIDGTIYFKGAQPLHQHTGEGYIEVKQNDGSINYVCPLCGNVMYVINNAAINGTYYADAMTSFVFENGVLTANGETFNYTFNETTGTLTVEGLNEGVIAYVNGKIVYRGRVELHTHDNSIFTEVTEPTCSKEGYTTYICQFCGPLYDADEVPATGMHSYVEVDRTETEVFYACTECGESYSEDVITHTHTEVEIPAVLPLPSNNHVGYTAGIICSDCGEILVPQQAITANPYGKGDGAFKFTGATLTLAENISVNYKATMPTNYTNVYVVFDFINDEFIVNDYTLSSGKYSFNLSETRPHLMNENIIAYLYAIDENGDYVYYEHSAGYSIVTYCFNTMKKLDLSVQEDKDEYTMFSDILVLGAETQKYVNASTPDSELVTNIVEAKLTEYFKQETKLTPSTFPESLSDDLNKQKVLGDKPTSGPDWSGVSLLLGSTTEISFKFMATSLEGVTAKVTFDGEEYYYTAEDFVADETVANKYSLNFSKINSLQYGEVALAEFFVDGESFGRTVEYSIYTYIQKNYTKINNQTDLIKALYNYSESVIKIYG